MIGEYKASELRKHVLNAHALVLAKKGLANIDEMLAVNRLRSKLKNTIESKLGSDLDLIQTESERLISSFDETAQKQAKGDVKKYQEIRSKIFGESEEYAELTKKETELMSQKIEFALDNPVVLAKTAWVAGEEVSIQDRMPDMVVGVKYRSQEMQYNPWQSLIELMDAGFIVFAEEEEETETEVKPLKAKKKTT